MRISVYGASHTSSDRFTGRLREVLQKRWGDGGKGHVLPGPLYKWYGGRHISTCWSDGWLSDWINRDEYVATALDLVMARRQIRLAGADPDSGHHSELDALRARLQVLLGVARSASQG